MHQHVRGRGEPQPQLIGAERSAGESIGKQIELRFLDAVFHFTARAVQLFVEFTLPGNPFDGHTLQSALSQVERLTDTKPKRCFVDRGYRGHGIEDTEVYIAGQKRGITRALRRALKQRNAIEPIIGHTKHDGLMGRNYLKGSGGDAMNAILAAAGHNLRLILRKLRLSWLCFLRALLEGKTRSGILCPLSFSGCQVGDRFSRAVGRRAHLRRLLAAPADSMHFPRARRPFPR